VTMTEAYKAIVPKKKWVFEPVNCAFCEVDDASVYFETDKYDEGKLTFVRCNRCGLIYQNPCPTRESMANLFGSLEFISAKQSNQAYEKAVGYWDYIEDENFRLPMAKYRLKRIERLTGGKNLNILKIACGTGTLLYVAKQKGHEVTGVDLSPFFCRFAKEKYDLDLINDWFENVDFGKSKYDVIAMLGAGGNVHEPKQFYRKICALLKDDGLFFVNDVPVDSWVVKLQGTKHFGFKPPALQLFPKKVMLNLLEQCGFEIVSDSWDYQYTNLAKILLFLRIKLIWKALSFLPLEKIVFKLPVPGNYSLICRKRNAANLAIVQ
jgi:SAM-dependent methyltransferase